MDTRGGGGENSNPKIEHWHDCETIRELMEGGRGNGKWFCPEICTTVAALAVGKNHIHKRCCFGLTLHFSSV